MEVLGGRTRWKYLVEVPGKSTQWKYLVEVLSGSTWWKYLVDVPGESTSVSTHWKYLVGGSTRLKYLRKYNGIQFVNNLKDVLQKNFFKGQFT